MVASRACIPILLDSLSNKSRSDRKENNKKLYFFFYSIINQQIAKESIEYQDDNNESFYESFSHSS